MKKIRNFICSMRFALILLGLLAIVCVAGSVITQGNAESYYTSNYPEKAAQLILLLGIDDVFHTWWFAGLTAILCLNLFGCNLLRFPQIIRQMKNYHADQFEKKFDSSSNPELILQGDIRELFTSLGFRKTESGKNADGIACQYGCRNRFGIWGAWLTHLGMFIIIVGFALGQIYTVKYTVYGVPGQTKAIGDTGFELTIDDFSISLREDETVNQYTAQLTMTNTATDESESGEASVNHPLSLFGMKLYQNSTGWAANVTIVKDDEEIVQEGTLCAGEYTHIGDVEGLYVMFNAFYPDYIEDEDGSPATASSELNNPGYLYTVYYNNEVLGMNVLTGTEMITIDNYSIIFRNPQQYTLIQIKNDPFTGIALVGALIIMAALLISFYMRTEELYALQKEDGSWLVYGSSRKSGILYQEKLKAAVKKLNEGNH